MKDNLAKLWKENKSLFIFIGLMLVFRSAVADWSDVPTGSMKPTIVEGDRIFINKMAYDIRLPFTHISLVTLAEPQTNDIIIFDSAVSDKRLVKRVIGVPGDTIIMKNNKLIINGQVISYQETLENNVSSNDYHDITETINGQPHFIRTGKLASQLANFHKVLVPAGQYLVLGDNRDNSADSRVIGLVPRNEIVGRSSQVAFSLDYNNNFLPRSNRFFHSL
ncbi:signal peptidase I [Colwellia hornerae]|uniref:Signal peptidase I n=1 Tax=Colwellia hornerae TaxID=89402 RepID=A0A5C6QPS6_9GAMM|nr:signal peptidase I [Colwellia hornerae]TWX56339.1 signal peptidase I [Colwellia hornerae]TWX62190.1 signal peptidase I [Colwellia hornerae]TWX70592.1 signal peptidase I [Colwellia hornerae]